MTLPVVVDEVVLDYADAARNLHELAVVARKDGWTEWSYELEGLASIADHAADIEARDPDPLPAKCGTCGGLRVCDITAHVARLRA